MNLGAIAGLCAVVLLAGCSSETPPSSLPTVSPAAQSPSPGPAEPEAVPEAAKVESGAGASAFARHFVQTLDEAFSTPNSEALRPLVAPGCEGCENLIFLVEELEAQGARRTGGEYVLLDVVSPAPGPDGVVVDFSYERTAGSTLAADGRVVDSSPAVPPTTAQMRLIRDDENWLVQGYRVLS